MKTSIDGRMKSDPRHAPPVEHEAAADGRLRRPLLIFTLDASQRDPTPM